MKHAKPYHSNAPGANRILAVLAVGMALVSLAQCKEKAPEVKGPTPLKYEEIALDPAKATDSEKQTLQTFDAFQKDLQARLMSEIKSGGPSKAIEVCRTASPEMEKKMSVDATIVRISDRERNPEHKAAGREAEVLALWGDRVKAGQEIGPVVFTDGGERKIMRPIKIAGELCLKCHGPAEKIDAATADALKKAYPADHALGYALGDLRGAFVARSKASK